MSCLDMASEVKIQVKLPKRKKTTGVQEDKVKCVKLP